MKLEDFFNACFVVSVLVPGFIDSGVRSALVRTGAHKEKVMILLRYLTATAFNDAICSSLIPAHLFATGRDWVFTGIYDTEGRRRTGGSRAVAWYAW
jgi:hypothetical protein